MSIRLSLPAAAAALLAASSASATTFNFATVSGDKTPTTFDGATFTSSPDTAGYVFGPNGGVYSTLGATVLSSGGFVESLKISFSAPVTSYSLDFALGDFFGVGDLLTVTPNVGAAKTYASTIPGADFFPQGVVSGTSSGLTSLTFSSLDPIAISNLVTTGASVPEPVSTAVLGAGLLGLLGARSARRPRSGG